MNLPKRRKRSGNPYILGLNNIITFIDSKGNEQIIELSDEVYNEFNNFELLNLKEMNEYDRHILHCELSDECLYHKSMKQHRYLEDIVLEKIINKRLHYEIEKLSDIQRRRLKMYYFKNMTLNEIAKKEGCSIQSVYISIESAKEKLKKNLK